ncbi:MAG: hypothetical protein K9I94_13770 [Bacteroidales bacterium]|nr:hypothetical protein [Bacteroidales bacterium]
MKDITTLSILIFFILNNQCLAQKSNDCISNSNCSNKKIHYWESIDDDYKEKIIFSGKINELAIDYYNGDLEISDDSVTTKLLDILVQFKKTDIEAPFYFFLFNKILISADGAASEILGKYCQKITLNNPIYILNYFSQNAPIMKKYSFLLGYELYFKQEGLSTLKYNLEEYENAMYKKIRPQFPKNKKIEQTADNFFKEIKQTMKRME